MNRTKLLIVLSIIAPLASGSANARVLNEGPYQAGAAAAQYNYQRYGDTGYAQGGDVANTCVKLCRHDSNPCDPPVYKQADGRCNTFD